ncbi:MAG: hypothetical protein UW30_C0016G0014 [Candidatus Giovannonibacteria bacterium GW2011_GWA2_44_13b]|uniref:Transglycosylase SLT domain-containing protein n=1 Tax=Candidatus Giovannonibacteria bacterium GW2011_GWA2_44_13b TaxID=1618647 RepID=A0A0G1H2Y4_9BACT|nr:MAG: hypothetical protein UW30_C0016G0014 [Candidatus Giovannonibacteria bacterium GW2011_GWA2_44_13b]
MKKIFFLSLVFLFFPAQVFAETDILQKVREAQKMLEPYEMKFETALVKTPIISKKTKKIIGYRMSGPIVTAKPVILAAWDRDEDKFYPIELMVAHPVQCSVYSFKIVTLGFRVEHVEGCVIGRLVFNVWMGEKKLLVLAGKHFRLPPELSKTKDLNLLEGRTQIGIYTSYSDDLYSKELVNEGYKFLSGEIKKAFGDLRSKQIVSRSQPGKLLADAFPEDYLLNLAINEQMDHSKFYGDSKRTAEEILITDAYNLENAFMWAVSSANAKGRFQFTNNGSRGKPGTYDTVVLAYEEADLIDDFEAGTQDLQNMIKIALCLLDMELAKFPPDVHELYRMEYRKAAIYPSACYNGGCGTGLGLYRWIQKTKYDITIDNFNPSAQAFTYITYKSRYVKSRKTGKIIRTKTAVKVVNMETPVYLKKQMYLWGFIDELKQDLEGGN